MLGAAQSTIYPTADLAASRAWFVEQLGLEPYFDETVKQAPVVDVGEGIRLGALRERGGSLLGVIENPNVR